MKLKKIFDKATANPVVTDLSPYAAIVNIIKERDHRSLPDEEFRARTSALKAKVLSASPDATAPPGGRPLPDAQTLIDVFALVREASRRTIGLDPFDVQMIAGAAMAEGGIAELPTGEGKTLAAVFPACLHALSGRGVHILTFNDYLARRDAAWIDRKSVV
jgi:preprotein translocase subunit SecA